MPAKKKSFPVYVCAYVHHYYPPLKKKKERKKEKTGRWKKESQEAEQKDEKAHWSKHYNRSQLIATKCLFFWKKKWEWEKGKENMITIVFETNIIKQTSGVTIELTVKMNKFTQTVTTTAILFFPNIQY